MHIDNSNYVAGNKAMASVLLLYYHLLREGGITNDQTVFLDVLDFDAFSFLDVTIDKDHSIEIDEQFLREGAAISLLCDLNDMISEHEDDYWNQPLTKRILSSCEKGKLNHIEGIEALVRQVRAPMVSAEDFQSYQNTLQKIYEKHVVKRIKSLLERKEP
jgi:hypothetical protein